MPSLKPRIIFVVDRDLYNRVDDFKQQHDFRSKAEAIIWMIKYVLREKPSVPPKEERKLIYYED